MTMHSMTGFGQAARENERTRVTVTLRAVNHRFLDLAIRLRDEHRGAEPALREVLGGRLVRGRVEVGVEVVPLVARPVSLRVDDALATALVDLAGDLGRRGFAADGPRLADLLRLPGAIEAEPAPEAWSAADQETLLAAAAAALEQLVAERAAEGEKLCRVLLDRAAELDRIVERLEARRAEIPAALRETLHARLAELLGDASVDPERLAQEVAYLADRSDVSEELDRLRTHLGHLRTLTKEEGGVGKRLDFLSQEILRELNTVGSKCRDAEMARQVMEGKSVCEQVREQVQNVE